MRRAYLESAAANDGTQSELFQLAKRAMDAAFNAAAIRGPIGIDEFAETAIAAFPEIRDWVGERIARWNSDRFAK